MVGFESDGSLIYVEGTEETAAEGPKYTDGVKLAEYGVDNLTDMETANLLSDPNCRSEDADLLRAEQARRGKR